jgi:transcriptional regulator with XRE-family HTH domain
MSSNGDALPSIAEIGRRLRQLRELRGLSLEQAGALLDMSPSFLSLVERGKSDLALGRFGRVCEGYGIHPSELLLEHVPAPPPVIRRMRDAPTIERGEGVTYRLVRSEHPQVMEVEMEPRTAFNDLRAHQGEDFVVVLDGAIDVLHGAGRYPVRAGETCAFASVEPHGIANPHQEPARLVIVASAPYW